MTISAAKFAAVAAALTLCAAPASAATSILFIGNSLDFGSWGAVHYYKTNIVHDLNGPQKNGKTNGGVPAVFKEFTREAGLDYDVSSELTGGQGLDYHLANKMPLIEKSWDVVVMHGYSSLNQKKVGDGQLVIDTSKQMADRLRAKNPNAKIFLASTWGRPDLTYAKDAKGPWVGKTVQQMGLEVERVYEQAARNANIPPANLVPIALATNRAIDTGFGDGNNYDGVDAGKVNMFAFDGHHGTDFNYYLSALMYFGKVTGKDPLSLGPQESVAEDLGFSPAQTTSLQKIAHDQLADQQQASAR